MAKSDETPVGPGVTITLKIPDAEDSLGDLEQIKDFNAEMNECGLKADGLNLQDEEDDLLYSGKPNVGELLRIIEILLTAADDRGSTLYIKGTNLSLE